MSTPRHTGPRWQASTANTNGQPVGRCATSRSRTAAGVEPAAGQRLMQAAMGASEARLQTQRVKQGLEPGPEPAQRLDRRAGRLAGSGTRQ